MAHGRVGPDIVMTTRYAGVSEIRAVSDHEANRNPDASSAIDPLRSHLNKILLGPATQQEALNDLWKKGVRQPTQQAERPYVQTVLSASPSFFALHNDEDASEWDQVKIDLWVKETMTWLKKEYGHDLVHVSLHLDETTPHMHILIVPTYEKKLRKPAQRLKAKVPETDEDFAARLKEWEDGGPTTRTAGRASSPYWSNAWARKDARASYHSAMKHLGLGYGKDFVGEGENSPENKKTGAWVREEAKRLADERAAIAIDRFAMIDDVKISAGRIRFDADRRATEIIIAAKKAAKEVREEVEIEKTQLSEHKSQLYQDRADLEADRNDLNDREAKLSRHVTLLISAMSTLRRAVDIVRNRLGLSIGTDLTDDLAEIDDVVKSFSVSSKKPVDDAGPSL